MPWVRQNGFPHSTWPVAITRYTLQRRKRPSAQAAPFGLFEFNPNTNSLCNAAGTFQQLTVISLSGRFCYILTTILSSHPSLSRAPDSKAWNWSRLTCKNNTSIQFFRWNVPGYLGNIVSLHYTTLHYIKPHYTTPHYTTPHHTTLHYTKPHYTTLHYIKPHYTTLYYTKLNYQYTTLHYTTLHHTTLHYTTLHYTTPHHTTLNHTTPHYTTLHYTTLHYTTLHYRAPAYPWFLLLPLIC